VLKWGMPLAICLGSQQSKTPSDPGGNVREENGMHPYFFFNVSDGKLL
jgi:hypothetical protein